MTTKKRSLVRMLRVGGWLRELESLLGDLPECADADGVAVRDGATRVVATFNNEAAADAFLVLVGDYNKILYEWAQDETEIGELQGLVNEHERQSLVARAELAAKVKEGMVELENVRSEITELRKQLALAKREKLRVDEC